MPPSVGNVVQEDKAAAANGPADDERALTTRNKDLANANNLLRQEIERLQKVLAADVGTNVDSQLPPAGPEESAPDHSQDRVKAAARNQDPAASAAVSASAGGVAASAAIPGPQPPDDGAPIDFDKALDATVGCLYDELQRSNLELRSSYSKLASENSTLKAEREQMRTTLMRICYGLEELVTDIRVSVVEPAPVKPPPRGSDLEEENRKLEKTNNDLFAANRKLRKDNEVLQSELSSRQMTRAATRSNSRGTL